MKRWFETLVGNQWAHPYFWLFAIPVVQPLHIGEQEYCILMLKSNPSELSMPFTSLPIGCWGL